MSDELWRLGAVSLARKIAAKETSSREVIEAHLARIEALNPVVNPVTVTLADAAMKAAEAADELTASGEPIGPLHGVPFTVKENLDVAGSATTSGVVSLRSDSERSHRSIRLLARRADVTIVCGSNVGADACHRWAGAAPSHRSRQLLPFAGTPGRCFSPMFCFLQRPGAAGTRSRQVVTG